ncbi:cytochrome P450 [Streptomyces sp. NBC_01795]|uniref:cytochrome P450 n=1 Tax=unclassified Streptomyces TaxID=2593676 RepID=UPI002DDA39E9|nr:MULTISPECIES: cytochrome P450 [unclassified Streptomyces]WSA90408.1 cytochrome P450 [Streptomyces sp. NBC_01795]WSB74635.1 cytochrome P450 [Streptomyces sp. NBC_01775]WSS16982.1 cytochrome P450 [Streptomyces sp. NBC_01186]
MTDTTTTDSETAETAPHAAGAAGSVPPVFFPLPRESLLDPPAVLARWRQEQPVHMVALPGGRHTWLVTRYADARAVLTDPRFSSMSERPGFPTVQAEPIQSVPGAFLEYDPPAHGRLRRMLTKDFTPKRVAGLRPAVERITGGLLDALCAHGPPADLVEHFALPLPVAVICEVLGVPYEDRHLFHEWGRLIGSLTAPSHEVSTAVEEFDAYLRDLLRAKAAEPRDDLLSRLMADQVHTGELALDETVGVAMVLLVAGHDPSSKALGLAVVQLLQAPELQRELCAAPERLSGVVEELLRFLSPFHTAFRQATENVTVGGVTVRADEGVLVSLQAANHDPGVFEEPDRLHCARNRPRHHLGFGYGIHQCLGQHLARLELTVALRELFRRLPGLRLAVPVETLAFQERGVVDGPAAVPVRW